MSVSQMDLFVVDRCMPLFPFWQKCLRAWPSEVFEYWHYRDCSGWSMAMGGFSYAVMLYDHGQITRLQFDRWHRFELRVKRWDERGEG